MSFDYADLSERKKLIYEIDAIGNVEEQLQAARRLYNANVSAYNQAIIVFPGSLVANSMHLTKREFFEAEETKKADVKIEF